MKRDIFLIRKIAQEIEENKYSLDDTWFVDDGHDQECCSYHIGLMRQAGLIDDKNMLTNKGLDFVALSKNNRIWQDVRLVVNNTLGSVPIDVYMKVAEEYSLKLAKAALPL